MRFIDADKIDLRVPYSVDGNGEIMVPLSAVKQAIAMVPTEDVVKVVRGEWIEHDDDWCGVYYTCSACGCDWTTIDGTPQENNMKYCPECGAKMDGERKDKP